MEIIEQQLADADHVSRRSSVRGDILGDALLERQNRIANLEVRLSQMEAALTAERERAGQLASAHPDVSELRGERDVLRQEVTRLGNELQAAHEQRDAAEARCDLLERQLAAVEHPAALQAAPPLRMPKVLVVDDQPDNLLAMTAVLETLDQELVTVSSGRDALKALLHHDDFAVIIMDVQMPEMDGYETAAHIKRRPRNRDVPIIFLTAMGVDPSTPPAGTRQARWTTSASPSTPGPCAPRSRSSPRSTSNAGSARRREPPPGRRRRRYGSPLGAVEPRGGALTDADLDGPVGGLQPDLSPGHFGNEESAVRRRGGDRSPRRAYSPSGGAADLHDCSAQSRPAPAGLDVRQRRIQRGA